MAISVKTRPGRAAITTIACDRKTDSNTEWVTKTTVGARLPQRKQIVVELKARDLVERRERLVHQQQLRPVTRARAIETRIFMPPESSRG